MRAVTLVILLAGTTARAHAVGLSRGEYRIDGATVSAELTFARADAAALVQGISEGELASSASDVAQAIVDGVVVKGEGCRGQLVGVDAVEADGLSVRARYVCDAVRAPLRIEARLLESLAPGHRHLARLTDGSSSADAVLSRGSAALELAPSRARVATAMLVLGIEHILAGADHLVFLFGLVLVAARLRDVLAVVTSFTAAHSITLGAAAFGVWSPSPQWVEPLIALSVAYVGIENFFIADAGRRWLLTFLLGLVHGFGFAGALSEAAPPTEVPLALAAFNVGVELGQLLVLAVVLPVLSYARRSDVFARYGVRVLSALVVVPGVIWFVARVLEV